MHTARVVCRTVHPRPTLGHQNIITRPAYLLHPLVLFNVSIRKALEILSDTSLLVTPTIRGHFMVFESYRRIIQFFSQVLTHERWWRVGDQLNPKTVRIAVPDDTPAKLFQ